MAAKKSSLACRTANSKAGLGVMRIPHSARDNDASTDWTAASRFDLHSVFEPEFLVQLLVRFVLIENSQAIRFKAIWAWFNVLVRVR